MHRHLKAHLYDIVSAVDEVYSFFENIPMRFDAYQSNLMLKRAVERNIGIIGEAVNQNNEFEIPEYLTFNVYGSYRFGNTEVGLRVNNILNRTNYYNAAIGIDTMWFRESGTNFFADLKFYF